MSRTFRKKTYNSCALRHPKTSNEIRQITHLLDDLKEEDYTISGVNHLHRRLNIPTYYESDYEV